MNGFLYIAGATVLIILLVIGSLAMKKYNVGAGLAVKPTELIYSKDYRTGICYAQGSNLLATVPCDKVEKFLQ